MSSSKYSWVQLKFAKLCDRKKLSELDAQQEQGVLQLYHVALQ